ncbi:MAG TPA: PP0621 family protein [Burkholderiaceae bacterium]|jgi:uncharacterized protein|nr:PP0621 family protein [Burkholderiaceae bacterium]
MGKILSWIVLIALVYAGMRLFVVFQRKSQAAALARERRARDEAAGRAGASRPSADLAPDGSERMLACAHCGAWSPASQTIAARGLHYCSPEHRDADRA